MSRRYRPIIAPIVDTVAEFFGVEVDDIYSNINKKEVNIARQTSVYFITRMCCQLSHRTITSLFNRNHDGFVKYSIEHTMDRMHENTEVEKQIDRLYKILKQVFEEEGRCKTG